MREPKRVLTQALVQDLNDLGQSGHKIVLVFDNYEAIGDAVNPWLLEYLLALAEALEAYRAGLELASESEIEAALEALEGSGLGEVGGPARDLLLAGLRAEG